ncbi:MAG: OmpA family protein [Myxococcales bacterium]|nr:OmpA family protein [Myxococcales bacterium]
MTSKPRWVALLLLSAPMAHAQSVPLDRFEPAPAGDTLLSVPDADVRGHLLPAAGLVMSYAKSPLVLRRTGSAGGEVGDVVSHQLLLHAQGSLELFHRLSVELDAPFTLSQAGDSPTTAGTRFGSPSGAAFSDIRTGARLSLLSSEAVAAAVSATAWWPSGDDGAYAGSGETRYGGAILLGGELGRWSWRSQLGRRVAPDASPLTPSLGSDLSFGAGAAYHLGRVQLGAEVFGSTRDDLLSAASTPLEALASVKARVGPFVMGGGAGPGLTTAAGTPAYRVVASVSFAPEAGPRPAEAPAHGSDTERDRRAPDAAQGASTTTTADRDGDGVPDATDQCPDVVGEASGPRPGCPPDRDGDGIIDVDDHCPDVPGVLSADPDKNGCPSDRDGDGIVDTEDACPDESGKRTEDPKTNGCPESVRVVGEQIVILQQVNFQTGKDRIESSSDALLGQVAQVMKEHPEIARVAVDGHTDSVGTARANLALSRRRAIAVMRWLVAHGVDERRLEARGFGPRRPIADNKTAEGRAKNRRVEFQILKRTDKGEAGWKDGPVDE